MSVRTVLPAMVIVGDTKERGGGRYLPLLGPVALAMQDGAGPLLWDSRALGNAALVASGWLGSSSARTVWWRWDGGAARAGKRIRLRNHGALWPATSWQLHCRTSSVSSKRHPMARKIE